MRRKRSKGRWQTEQRPREKLSVGSRQAIQRWPCDRTRTAVRIATALHQKCSQRQSIGVCHVSQCDGIRMSTPASLGRPHRPHSIILDMQLSGPTLVFAILIRFAGRQRPRGKRDRPARIRLDLKISRSHRPSSHPKIGFPAASDHHLVHARATHFLFPTSSGHAYAANLVQKKRTSTNVFVGGFPVPQMVSLAVCRAG